MKALITLLMIFFSTLTFSQARMGFSSSALLVEFSDPVYRLESITSNGITIITVKFTDAIAIYRISQEYDMCYNTLIVPLTTVALSEYIALYDNQYSKINGSEWRAVVDGDVFKITLLLDNSVGYYFLWQP